MDKISAQASSGVKKSLTLAEAREKLKWQLVNADGPLKARAESYKGMRDELEEATGKKSEALVYFQQILKTVDELQQKLIFINIV